MTDPLNDPISDAIDDRTWRDAREHFGRNHKAKVELMLLSPMLLSFLWFLDRAFPGETGGLWRW